MTYDSSPDTFPAPTADAPFSDLNPTKPLPILIRATDGNSKKDKAKKLRLSTIVDSDTLESFFARYAEVCKAGMSGLKKRDRSKLKAKMKAKKRKGGAGTEDVKKA